MDTETFKFCPFCESTEAEVVIVFQEQNWYAVQCKNCNAFGPSAGTDSDAKKYWDEREPDYPKKND